MAETDPYDLTDAIAESAVGPAKVVIDGQVSEQHALPDQVASSWAGGKRRGPGGPAFRRGSHGDGGRCRKYARIG